MSDEINGHCDPAFAAVREVFAENFARGEEMGAAVAVYAGGRLVADLWGGVANHTTGRAWQHDTPCLTFSCTKAVTAAAALWLAERGAFDLTGPVRDWWPRFAAAGKSATTAEHLLSHQAGLPAFDEPISVEEAADPAALADRLATQTPRWEPGTDHGYHALTYGWLAGELVRRHAGQPVGRFVAEEIAGDLELWLGADDDLIARTARLTTKRPRPADDDAGGRPATPPASGPVADMMAAMSDPDSLMNRAESNPAPGPGGYNNPELLRAGWPSAGGIATARGLAGFYRDLVAGGVVAPDTLRGALKPRVSGPDRVLHVDSAFGLGFMRPSSVFLMPRAARDTAFGHTGASGAIGVGDIEHELGIAYVTNRVGTGLSGGRRAHRLVDAVYRSVG